MLKLKLKDTFCFYLYTTVDFRNDRIIRILHNIIEYFIISIVFHGISYRIFIRNFWNDRKL